MRLIFVHGIRQEGKPQETLKDNWEGALRNAWTALGIPIPAFELVMPYYGDELDALTREVRGPSAAVIARGGAPAAAYSAGEVEMLRQLAKRAGATDADIRQELGQAVVARGPANWEWVQGIARWLSRNAPWLSEFALDFVRQVDAYLDRPHIQQAVDAIVGPALREGPSVVVAHSLGSIVSYRLLRRYGTDASVKLFVTLGSPLGIDVVKARLKPPRLKVPDGVERWLHGADERDYVALEAALNARTFAADIENLTDIHNSQADPHSIWDYLSDPRIAKRIAETLR